MLVTIAKFNSESIADITEKILILSSENYWEIKAQCICFASTIMNSFRHLSHLLATKDDNKLGVASQPAIGIMRGISGKPGSAAGGGDAN